MRRWLLCLLALAALHGAGAAPPSAEVVERLDRELPLQAEFRDEAGRPVRLGDYFGSVPVVLVLGYFECRNLCGTIMDGVLESLAQAALPASAYRLLAVSVDPREDAATARRRMYAYRSIVVRDLDAHFLTGTAQASGALAAGVGVPVVWDGEHDQYAHPAGFIVVTPQGRIARYFGGVRFDGRDVRLALVGASAGRVGAAIDRLWLLCAHYDPQSGRYSVAAMTAMRGVGALTALLLAAWLWRRRGGRR